MYMIKRVVYEDIGISIDQLVTISEAAEMLGMTKNGVISAMNRGVLSEITDLQAVKYRKGRRLLIKSEVMMFERREN